MGTGIIIDGISFKNNNVGKATIIKDTSVRGIFINCSSHVIVSEQLEIVYTPLNTSQMGVVWSILDGPATISPTGLLTVTGNGVVTVYAESTYDSTINATKKISVGAYLFGSYIEWPRASSTKKYVDTGTTPSTSIEMEIEINPVSDKTATALVLGQRNANSGGSATDKLILWFNYVNDNTYEINGQYMNTETGNQLVAPIGRHEYKVDSQGLHIDDTTIQFQGTPSYVQPSRSCYLGASAHQVTDNAGIYAYGAKLYSFSIDEYQFVPAKRISDDAVGMFCQSLDRFVNFANLQATFNE